MDVWSIQGAGQTCALGSAKLWHIKHRQKEVKIEPNHLKIASTFPLNKVNLQLLQKSLFTLNSSLEQSIFVAAHISNKADIDGIDIVHAHSTHILQHKSQKMIMPILFSQLGTDSYFKQQPGVFDVSCSKHRKGEGTRLTHKSWETHVTPEPGVPGVCPWPFQRIPSPCRNLHFCCKKFI